MPSEPTTDLLPKGLPQPGLVLVYLFQVSPVGGRDPSPWAITMLPRVPMGGSWIGSRSAGTQVVWELLCWTSSLGAHFPEVGQCAWQLPFQRFFFLFNLFIFLYLKDGWTEVCLVLYSPNALNTPKWDQKEEERKPRAWTQAKAPTWVARAEVVEPSSPAALPEWALAGSWIVGRGTGTPALRLTVGCIHATCSNCCTCFEVLKTYGNWC